MDSRLIHVLYHPDRSWRWGGDDIARAVADCVSSFGYQTTLGGTSDEFEDKTDTLLLVGSCGAAAVRGFWRGPVYLYNFSETYLEKRDWLRAFGRDAAKWSNPKIDAVLDYSPNNAETFRKLGIRSTVYCPLGYHRFFEIGPFEHRHPWGFIGKVHWKSWRETALLALYNRFGGWFGPGQSLRTGQIEAKFPTIPALRIEALSSRVFLHLHSRDSNFPAPRVIQLGLSNGACVLAEESSWTPGTLTAGEHYVTTPPGNLPRLVQAMERLLDDDEERIRISSAGYAWVRHHWQLRDHLRTAFDYLENM